MAKTKSDFMLAITQLAAEKNLPREVVLGVVENALISAFRKNSFGPTQKVSVKLNPETGKVNVFAGKMVVEEVTDPRTEVSLTDAKKVKKHAQIGDEVDMEDTPTDAGRIAAQTAKQVVLQRLREAERELVFEEFAEREAELVTGIVQRIEPRQLILDLGRTEGVLPSTEQVRTEHYRAGQRLKAYIVEVHRTGRGPQVIVSRTHKNLLRRLLDLEVPEINSGAIELKAIAREAGYRSKVAVSARQPGIDAVGSCVGLRGIRIQNIVNELSGEKIDVIEWDPDPATFIANALSPAQVVSVSVNEEEKAATVVVPDRQLSLAIGKEGQNARLAARLTGWRIDIKSTSTAEAEEVAIVEEAAPPEQPAPAEEEPEAIAVAEEPVSQLPAEEARLLAPEELVPDIEGEIKAEPEAEEEVAAEQTPVEEPAPVIRFAEDIMPSLEPKPGKKSKRGKGKAKATDEDKVKSAVKPKKARAPKVDIEDEEYEEMETPLEEAEASEIESTAQEEEPQQPAETAGEDKPAKRKKKGKAKATSDSDAEATVKASTKSKKTRRAPKARTDEDEFDES